MNIGPNSDEEDDLTDYYIDHTSSKTTKKQDVKFKVGDKLFYIGHDSIRIADARVIQITSVGYEVSWYKTETEIPIKKRWTTRLYLTFEEAHKDYVLYDSPECVWLRL